MSDENVFSIDRAGVREAFAEAIKKEATAALRVAVNMESVGASIRDAFGRKWLSSQDSLLDESVRDALQHALWASVRQAVEEAGVAAMVKEIVTEYVGTPEFREGLKASAIEAIKSTSFHVMPKGD